MTASTTGSAATTNGWRAWLANALLAVGSVLLCLLVPELGTRWFVEPRGQEAIIVLDVDLSTRLAFLPGRERRYETPELRYTVKTNRFGRRDREWSDADLADEGNLLFVGDSFVMGASVEDEDSIPTRLEAWSKARGTPREVFNFGMPSTGIPQYVQILEDALRIGVKARTVLVGVFVGNDFATGIPRPDRYAPARRGRAAPLRSSLPAAGRPATACRALSADGRLDAAARGLARCPCLQHRQQLHLPAQPPRRTRSRRSISPSPGSARSRGSASAISETSPS